MLAQPGFRVIVAENGARALALCAEAAPPVQLVVSDLVMPEMDGVSLLEHLRVQGGAPAALRAYTWRPCLLRATNVAHRAAALIG